MELYLKITVGVLLLVQVFHLASLQYSTDSPGRTIDKSWLRDRAKNIAESQNAAEEPTEYDLRDGGTAIESNDSGIPSGSMYISQPDDDNVTSEDGTADEEPDDLSVVNITALTPMDPNNSSQINMTDTEKEFNNSVTLLDSTSDQNTNHTDLQMTTSAPQGNDTQISTTKPDKDILTNDTDSTNTTDVTTMMPEINKTPITSSSTTANMTNTEKEFNNSVTTLQNSTSDQNTNHTDLQMTTSAPQGNDTQISTTRPGKDILATDSTNTTDVTTMMPDINKTPTASSSTTALLPETTETSPETTTTAAPETPEMTNKTEKGSGTGASSERGLESDPQRSKRNKAWGAGLGILVAVICVGLVVYVILKKKQQKGFTHRKLVEEYPSDSVLRFHSSEPSEPLDLNFGGSAYYNPGLQGDNIQMTSFPRHY